MKTITCTFIAVLAGFSLSACVTSSEPSEGVREGYLKYKKENHFKAFAATSAHPGGRAFAWGYSSNGPSAKEAVKDALGKCKKGGERYAFSIATECAVLYIGNTAVADSPVKDITSLTEQYQSTPAQFD